MICTSALCQFQQLLPRGTFHFSDSDRVQAHGPRFTHLYKSPDVQSSVFAARTQRRPGGGRWLSGPSHPAAAASFQFGGFETMQQIFVFFQIVLRPPLGHIKLFRWAAYLPTSPRYTRTALNCNSRPSDLRTRSCASGRRRPGIFCVEGPVRRRSRWSSARHAAGLRHGVELKTGNALLPRARPVKRMSEG